MSALVQAGEIRVASISQYRLWGSASVSQKFEFNPEMGRHIGGNHFFDLFFL
jgi:hypothetical protein